MGICALTNSVADFVDCHMIPKAFMKRVQSYPAYEMDGQQRPKKIYSHGWYDSQLVTREGEDILSLYDDEAAHCLIGSGLTYSKRRNPNSLELEDFPFDAPKIISIPVRNMNRLRLFALSLLWRTATSQRTEFKQVTMRARRLKELRNMVLSGVCGKFTDFPSYLGVFDSKKELVKIAPSVLREGARNIARFFLDGVVLYVSVTKHNKFLEEAPYLLIGSQKTANLIVLQSEGGWHSEYTEQIISETAEKYKLPFQSEYRTLGKNG